MRSASTTTRIIWLAIANATMLVLEVALTRELRFVTRAADGFLPLLVFGGVGLGGVLGLTPQAARLRPAQRSLGVAFVVALSLALLARVPDAAIPATVAVFAAYGALLARTLAELPLRLVVWALGLGGALTFLGVALIASRGEAEIAVSLVAAMGVAAVLMEPSRGTAVRALGLVAVASVTAALGGYAPSSVLLRTTAALAAASPARAPIYAPLFRTDLLELGPDRRAIVTNGRHWAFAHRRSRPPPASGADGRALVIGAAAGNDVSALLGRGFARVTAVDVNPAVFELMKSDLGAYTDHLYDDPRVEPIAAEGRSFLETTTGTFDFVSMRGLQTGSSADLVSSAAIESSLFTEQALRTMWAHLSPRGVLYFDEYEKKTRAGGYEVTLLDAVAARARETLALEPDQLLRASYWRGGLRDGSLDARELLMVFKEHVPLEERSALATLEAGNAITIAPARDHARLVRLTDDHPFFDSRLPSGALALTVLLAVAATAAIARGPRLPIAASIALAASGAGYLTTIAALMGPCALALGRPELATPVVFVTASACALAGGLAALRVPARVVAGGVVALVIYLGVAALEGVTLAERVAAFKGEGLRVLVVVAVIVPFALLAELPYVWLLSLARGEGRARAYAIENVGAAVGMTLCLALERAYGYSVALGSGGVAYALVLIVMLARPSSLEQ